MTPRGSWSGRRGRVSWSLPSSAGALGSPGDRRQPAPKRGFRLFGGYRWARLRGTGIFAEFGVRVNDKVKLAVALIALAGAGGYLVYFFKSQPKPGETVRHTQPLCCTACEKAFIAEAGDPPVECKHCGQPTAWRAAFCTKCNRVIPIVKESGQSVFKCVKCNGAAIREVTPDEISAQGG